MTRGLTCIQPDVVRRNADEIEQKIAVAGVDAVGWREHFRLAAYSYELEAGRDAIRMCFENVVRIGIAAHERAKEPTRGTRRTPWDFGQLLGVVAAFGDSDQRCRAGSIRRQAYLWPEDPSFALMADVYSVLQAFLHGEVDVGPAVRVAEQASAPSADRDAVEYGAPLCRAVAGLIERDESNVAKEVAAMARYHEHMARSGDLQFNAEGMIAVLPLCLVRLAREVGLDCTVKSPYVPVEIL